MATVITYERLGDGRVVHAYVRVRGAEIVGEERLVEGLRGELDPPVHETEARSRCFARQAQGATREGTCADGATRLARVDVTAITYVKGPLLPREALMRMLVIPLLLLAASCSSELSRTEAARLMEEHLRALPVGMDGMVIEPIEILALDEYSREFRFQVRPDSVAGPDTTGGPLYTAAYRKGDAGWSIDRYGAQLADVLVTLLAYIATDTVEALVAARDAIDDLASAWSDSVLAIMKGGNVTEANLDALERGIPGDVLRRAVEDAGVEVPDGIEWGVTEQSYAAHVLWLRFEADTTAVCARKVGWQREYPMRYDWLEDSLLGCRVGYHSVDPEVLEEHYREALARSGGWFTPQAARPPYVR